MSNYVIYQYKCSGGIGKLPIYITNRLNGGE